MYWKLLAGTCTWYYCGDSELGIAYVTKEPGSGWEVVFSSKAGRTSLQHIPTLEEAKALVELHHAQ